MTAIENIVLRNVIKQLKATESRCYGFIKPEKINIEKDIYPIAAELREVLRDLETLCKEM